MTSVNKPVLDTSITSKYKSAKEFKIPSAHVYIENKEYKSSYDLVESLIRKNQPPEEIFVETNKRGIPFTVDDFTSLYYERSPVKDDSVTKSLAHFREKYGFSGDFRIEDLLSQWRRKNEDSMRNDAIYLLTYINPVQKILSAVTVPVKIGTPDIKSSYNKFSLEWKDAKTSVSPWRQDNQIKIDDAIVIFNSMKASFDIPVIRFVDNNGESKYKIYNGSKYDPTDSHRIPQLLHMIQYEEISTAERKRQNSTNEIIYFIIWIETNHFIKNNNSYILANYNIRNNALSVEIPFDGKNIILQRISQCFDEFSLSQPVQEKIKAMARVFIRPINESVLHFMILNDLRKIGIEPPIFSIYLFVNESNISWVGKRHLEVYFKDISPNQRAASVKFQFVSSSDEGDGDMDSKEESDQEVEDEDSDRLPQYIKITAANLDSINAFMGILSHLLAFYDQFRDDIYSYLISMAPIIERSAATEKDKEKMTRLKFLKKRAPEIYKGKQVRQSRSGGGGKEIAENPDDFISKPLSRINQTQGQPIIINPEDREDWENYLFRGGRKKSKERKNDAGTIRRVLKFPPDPPPEHKDDFGGIYQKQWYFVCPGEAFGTINLTKNLDPRSRTKYPFIPDCLENPRTGEKSLERLMMEFYRQVEFPTVYKKGSSYRLAHINIGQERDIPRMEIVMGLRGWKAIEPKYSEDFVYVATPISPSSFLHCILLAVDNQYREIIADNSIRDKESKLEEYVNNYRRYISSRIDPNVYKQELFDRGDEEIKSRIADPKIYLDPYLYYRGMEELFNKNIYVFSITNMHPMLDTEIISDPVLEIPRYKLFHTRINRRNRETIIILKQMIGKTAFQCALIRSKGNRLAIKNRGEELFVDRNKGDDELKIDNSKTLNTDLFPKEMGDHLYKILSALSTNVEIRQNLSTDQDTPLSIRRNIFSKCNWEELFNGYAIIGQRIDEYGKMRLLTLRKQNDATSLISVYIPSSQPLNVPRADKIYSITDELAVQLFGNPSGINAYGLWFRIFDFADGVFVPTTRTIEYKDMPIIPIPLGIIESAGIFNPIDNVYRTRKDAEIFIKLVIWCWRHTLTSQSTSAADRQYENIDTWWEKYVIVNEDTKNIISDHQDKIRYYHYLPQVETCSDAIKSLSDRKFGWPEYFNDGSNTSDNLPKIMMYRKLYDKMKLYMKKVYTDNEGLSILPERGISGIFINEIDFIPRMKQLILADSEKLAKWEDYYRREAEEISIVYNDINMNFMFRSEPYICLYTEINKIKPLSYMFLIQNTRNKNINSALYLCSMWNTEKHNIGSAVVVPSDFSIDLNYIIFGITKSQKISPIKIVNSDETFGENKFDPSAEYLYILEYTKNDYAAMLPLSFFQKTESTMIPISIPLGFKMGIPSVKPSKIIPSIEVPSFISQPTIPSFAARPSVIPSTIPSFVARPSVIPSTIPSTITQPTIPSFVSRPSVIPPTIPSFAARPSTIPSTITQPTIPSFVSRPSVIPSTITQPTIPSFVSRPSVIPSTIPSFSIKPPTIPSTIPSFAARPPTIPSTITQPTIPSFAARPPTIPSIITQPFVPPSANLSLVLPSFPTRPPTIPPSVTQPSINQPLVLPSFPTRPTAQPLILPSSTAPSKIQIPTLSSQQPSLIPPSLTAAPSRGLILPSFN